jgi:alpha-galactosidase
MSDCRAEMRNGLFVIENSLIRREYAWNRGHLISRRLIDKAGGTAWELQGREPDCVFPGHEPEPVEGKLEVTELPASSIMPAHVRAEVTLRLRDLDARRVFRVYPDCPAIACDYYLRGRPERCRAGGPPEPAVMERLATAQRHLRATAVQFFDVTDRRSNLVQTRSVLPYRDDRLAGNLLLVESLLDGARLFILKEAPCSDMQLSWPGHDFVCREGEIRVVGIGIEPRELDSRDWRRCYGFVTGVATGGEYELLSALRAYQGNLRLQQSGRDHMIMLNTWGDRGQDTKLGEEFALAEIEAGARLGVTHFQLDDGWQRGRSSNSAYQGGSLARIWDRRDYWEVNEERFPNGLAPVAEAARQRGIELCLWFNPSRDDSYAHFQDDAAALLRLHQQYGIRTFKIDGVDIPDKQADLNFRTFLDVVQSATDNEAVFNLDATAMRRFGFHYLTQYGNIFLENRYTDWGNYYPHRTLRNLWQLSRYVPPHNLQIEFLNRWRNADKYDAGDPLAPCRVPFDYCFAITMVAQPLAWFEASNLPEEAFELAATITVYREYQEQIHVGRILPIGEEPCGTGWTGFQSCQGDCGYFAVYRELNDRETARLNTWGLAGNNLRCETVLGHGQDFEAAVSEDGWIEFSLPAPFTFALYRYAIVP